MEDVLPLPPARVFVFRSLALFVRVVLTGVGVQRGAVRGMVCGDGGDDEGARGQAGAVSSSHREWGRGGVVGGSM